MKEDIGMINRLEQLELHLPIDLGLKALIEANPDKLKEKMWYQTINSNL